MAFPPLAESFRLARLEPPAGPLHMVLDTDTYNEVDDQFALTYALLAPECLTVEAIYAAPFHNERSSSPADGMARSYAEILRLLSRLGRSPEGLVHKGSPAYLGRDLRPVESAAAVDLVQRALSRPPEAPLYVAAIAALTNIASAILLEPRIIERIVVVWLGGHALHWPDTREFNLRQDVAAARVVLDCGVPLVLIPCLGVASHLQTTVAEIERYVQGRGAIGDYLAETVKAYQADHFGWSKVIWDIAVIGYLLNPAWAPTHLAPSPIVTDQVTWSVDATRHQIRCAYHLHRDPIFRDLFTRLAGASRE